MRENPALKNLGRKNLFTVLLLAAVAVAVLLTMQLWKRDRSEETMKIDPAVERELAERDRAILTTGIAAAFPAWVKAWRSGDSRFDPTALRRDSIEAIDQALVTREDEVHVPLDDESLRALVSPDGTKYLEYTGGSEDGEPDSEVTLVDASRNERQRLLFYGPSVRFDDAAWIDRGTVVVVGQGSQDGGEWAGSVQPLVWIFHLSHRLVSTYTTTGR